MGTPEEDLKTIEDRIRFLNDVIANATHSDYHQDTNIKNLRAELELLKTQRAQKEILTDLERQLKNQNKERIKSYENLGESFRNITDDFVRVSTTIKRVRAARDSKEKKSAYLEAQTLLDRCSAKLFLLYEKNKDKYPEKANDFASFQRTLYKLSENLGVAYSSTMDAPNVQQIQQENGIVQGATANHIQQFESDLVNLKNKKIEIDEPLKALKNTDQEVHKFYEEKLATTKSNIRKHEDSVQAYKRLAELDQENKDKYEEDQRKELENQIKEIKKLHAIQEEIGKFKSGKDLDNLKKKLLDIKLEELNEVRQGIVDRNAYKISLKNQFDEYHESQKNNTNPGVRRQLQQLEKENSAVISQIDSELEQLRAREDQLKEETKEKEKTKKSRWSWGRKKTPPGTTPAGTTPPGDGTSASTPTGPTTPPNGETPAGTPPAGGGSPPGTSPAKPGFFSRLRNRLPSAETAKNTAQGIHYASLLRDRWKAWRADASARRKGNLFWIIALLLHFMKLGLEFNIGATWILDVLFGLIVYMFIFSPEDRSNHGLRNILIILALEIALPIIIGYNHALSTNKFMRYYFLNRILTPWWFYYAVIWCNTSEPVPRLAKLAKWFVVLFWFGVILTIPAIGMSKIPTSEFIGMQQYELAVDFFEKSVSFYDQGWDMIKRGFSSIGDAWRKQLLVATGGYYTGVVDENANKPLGVYIEDVKPSAPSFYIDSPSSVAGKLRIMSFDDIVRVNLGCYKGSKDAKGEFPADSKAQQVYPAGEIAMYNLEREDVDCMFDRGSLPRGTNKVTLTADFNFETMAYLKTYFMYQDIVRSLVGQGKDPLKEYGVTDTEPQAVYTSGPVRIGMGISEQPIAVDSSYNPQPRLGITLESNTGWKGSIKEVKELVILLPSSMTIDTKTCNFPFEEFKEQDTPEKLIARKSKCLASYNEYKTSQYKACLREQNLPDDTRLDESIAGNIQPCLQRYCEEELTGHNVYYLDVEKNQKAFKNIDKFITISCRININNPAEIMAGNPVTAHYFKAKARYKYQIEQDTTVTIKSPEGITSDKTPSRIDEQINLIHGNYKDEINNAVALAKTHVLSDENKELLTPCVMSAVMAVESHGGNGQVSPKGAEGLMQVMPATADEVIKQIQADPAAKAAYGFVDGFTYERFNADHNIKIGTYYFAKKIEEVADFVEPANRDDIIPYALASYNAGFAGVKCRVNGVDGKCADGQFRCLNKDSGKLVPFYSQCHSQLPKETNNYISSILPNGADSYANLKNAKEVCEGANLAEYANVIENEKNDGWSEVKQKEIKLSYDRESVTSCFGAITPEKQNAIFESLKTEGILNKGSQLVVIKNFFMNLRNTTDNCVYSGSLWAKIYAHDYKMECDSINIQSTTQAETRAARISTAIAKVDAELEAHKCLLKKSKVEGTEIPLDGTQYTLLIANTPAPIEQNNLQDGQKITIKAKLKYRNIIMNEWTSVSSKKTPELTTVGDNPFVQVYLGLKEEKYILYYTYHKDFVINAETIQDLRDDSNKQLVVTVIKQSTVKINDQDTTLPGMYATYDSSDIYLRPFADKGDYLCSLSWNENSQYEICSLDEHDVAGLRIVKSGWTHVKTYTYGIIENADAPSQANVQFIYEPNSYEEPCCSDPNTCKTKKSFALGTCRMDRSNYDCALKPLTYADIGSALLSGNKEKYLNDGSLGGTDRWIPKYECALQVPP